MDLIGKDPFELIPLTFHISG